MPSTTTRTLARRTIRAGLTSRLASGTQLVARTRVALGTALLIAVAVAACSGPTASTIAPGRGVASPGGSGSGTASTVQEVPGAVQGGAATQGEGAKDASGAAAVGDPAQKIARTAHLSMTVTDVAATATQVRGVAIGAGGSVTSENISTRPPGDDQPPVPVDGTTSSLQPADPANRVSQGESVPVVRGTNTALLTVSVPAGALDSVLDQLARLGTVVQRSSSSQDVTATYVDAQSRIATMKASLDRLRALMSKATEIGQIVTLETELTRREADLEALQARLAALDRQTTMSTVAVVLTAGASATPDSADGGFLGGLRSGWTAFTTLLGGLVTGVGAALPFLVTVLLLASPALLWWRRRRSAGRATAASPAAAETK